MAEALRPGGVYYVGGRLVNGKMTGGRWVDASGKPAPEPTKEERAARAEARAAAPRRDR
jgi:hypothetical protein